MKVAIYKDTFANNRGADIAVKNLAAGLSERGHAVDLFDKSELAVKVCGDFDVVISAGTNEILDLDAAEVRFPIVQQFHTDPSYPFRHWLKRWRRNRKIKAALGRVEAFQVLSKSYVDKLRGIMGDKKDIKVAVIGNWSSFENVVADLRREESKTIICPGAINSDKNQTLLVNAFSQVAEEFPDWRVQIYGKGSRRDEDILRRQIVRCGLAGKIELMGYQDLAEPYSRCAFVAFPSKTEGIPLSLVDAAMHGKPALTIHDWIGCTYAVAPENFQAGLRRFMADASLRREAGESARKYCLTHYSRHKIIDEWEALIDMAVHGS